MFYTFFLYFAIIAGERENMDGYYREEFVALLNEAQFTKEILGISVTQLYKANYAQKGKRIK